MLLLLRTNSVATPSELEPLAVAAVTIQRDSGAIADVAIWRDATAISGVTIGWDDFAINPAYSVIERL